LRERRHDGRRGAACVPKARIGKWLMFGPRRLPFAHDLVRVIRRCVVRLELRVNHW
jgi:hypothetical protein